jgi:predicted glycosyltransferase
MVISSGDSMAREAAMLGVPGIYCGVRDMAANRVLIDKKMLFKIPPAQVPGFIHQLMSGSSTQTIVPQDEFRAQLTQQWDDITRLILDIVIRYQNKNLQRSHR